ncbi:MAG: hypothetical protein RL556_68 [Actinomycetota bacterium]|jgi:CDP-diacylglycerol--glycerol-3-phosphate 3-phosphatidyltransferase
MAKPARYAALNLPNLITLLRIALVPFFIWLLLVDHDKGSINRWWATFLFVLAISTDGVDGAIARSRELVTNLGKILDPIADKALIGGGLVILSVLGELDWSITAVILIRELGITVYRLIVVKKRVIAASGGGKLKTTLQGVMLGFLISPLDHFFNWLIPFETVLTFTTVAITVSTGLQILVSDWKANKVAN